MEGRETEIPSSKANIQLLQGKTDDTMIAEIEPNQSGSRGLESYSRSKDSEETRGQSYGTTSEGKQTESSDGSKISKFRNEWSSLEVSYSEIMKATNDLSESSWIGRGGFGSVYKGKLGGTMVAIKILDSTSKQGEREFFQELEGLYGMQHQNLVKLLGACFEVRALVYEYLPNGSLEDCLEDSPELLTWQMRTRIIYEICLALHYLHSRFVIHSDLKPANILLDANFKSKLSDFGLCRFIPEGVTTNIYLETAPKGTSGYMDPWFFETGILRPGSDLFSFGITILKLLTRMPAVGLGRKIRETDENSLRKMIDTTAGNWPFELAKELVHWSLQCCYHNEKSMKLLKDISTCLEEMLAEIETLQDGRFKHLHQPTGSKISPPGNAESGQIEEHKALNIVPNLLQEEQQSASPAIKDFGLPDAKLGRLSIDRQHESNVFDLINCVVKKIGFSQGKPVAGFTIYKCLLHWKSLESEKTSVFDHLIQMMGSVIENQEGYDHLAYWLSNTSTLLILLQVSLKAEGRSGPARRRNIGFGRSSEKFRTSRVVVCQVKAKNPALLFKQQITVYVEKIYGMIHDNMKKDIGSLLSLCIQEARTATGSSLRASAQHSTQGSHWQSIINSLSNLLNTLQENCVPAILIQKIFTQIFSFVDVQLFNSVLLRRECCSFSNGEYLKSGLAELELWWVQVKPEYAGSSWNELMHIRQAVGFLVRLKKYRLSLDEITKEICPCLSVPQLYRISTMYWDDKYNTKTVSSTVLDSMKILMTEDSNNARPSTFLLEDDSSIPFSVDDISRSFQTEEFLHVKPAEELLEKPAFHFLLE